MSCPKSILLSSYLDEELQGSDKAALETHMQGCNRCSQSLEELRSLRAAFSTTQRHQAPYGFATRVMARTRELGEQQTPWHVPLIMRFAEVAVLLVVISVGVLAGRVMTNGSSTTTMPTVASSLSLDMFDATPPGSLGGAYLAMTEAKNEK